SRVSLLPRLASGRPEARSVKALTARIGASPTARLPRARFGQRRERCGRERGELDGADIASHVLRAADPALVRGNRSEGVDSEPGEMLLALEVIAEGRERAIAGGY